MRDLDQIREKIEIRLEPQQIVWAVLGIVLFSGGLFAGGYYLGSQNAPTPEAQPSLAAVDQASAETRTVVEKTAPAVVEAPEPALGEVEFLFPSELNSRPARKQTAVRLDAAVVAAPKPEKKAAPKAEKVEKPAPKPEKREAAKPVEKSVRLPDAGAKKVDAALAAARKAAKVAQAQDLDPNVDEDAPAHRPNIKYTLQVKAAREKSEADALMARIRKHGFEPYVILTDSPGKGRYYRVRLGRFDSKEDARKFQRRYKAKSGEPDAGFITEL